MIASNLQDPEYIRVHNPEVQATRQHPRSEEFECGWITNRDNQHLFYRGWKLKETSIPASPHIILHIHGMVSHSEPNIALADGLVTEDILLYGLDLIGHGHSEGVRGDYLSFTFFLQNIEDMLTWLAHKYPKAIFSLSGESMGGLAIALYLSSNFLTDPIIPINKALMWAPALDIAISKPTLPDVWMGITLIFKALICPHRISIKTLHEKTFRDPISQHFDEVDPTNLSQYSVRYLLNINWAMKQLRKLHGSQSIRTPFCIIQGDADQVVNKMASKKFYETSSIMDRCLFLSIPDAWHCIYKDPSFSEDHWRTLRQFIYT